MRRIPRKDYLVNEGDSLDRKDLPKQMLPKRRGGRRNAWYYGREMQLLMQVMFVC
jgi:hypothetical protein